MCYLDNENLILKKAEEERKKQWNLESKACFWNEATNSTFLQYK